MQSALNICPFFSTPTRMLAKHVIGKFSFASIVVICCFLNTFHWFLVEMVLLKSESAMLMKS
ncbi:hypothetical protein T4D_14991 [Trichinella pseudospiralis]|uniref:Biopterin-dependent aromatic amino acid hydroxylase family profile domain-containing protein n=1 Tax=Trichinella pseudospiralis TaxID=6337 RepID=A0A0V1FCZ1_TRIPS|nr:hypothetical protein T4D_14991 [Trichinella pseudospiralis]